MSTHLNLVSLMHFGYGHLKVEVLHNVMESFVELYLFIIGFSLEYLLHILLAVGQQLELHSSR
jgi:hypothetical protein